LLVDLDTSGPAVIQYAMFMSLDEALKYAEDNPVGGTETWLPPTGYTFFLNKTNVLNLISIPNLGGVDTNGRLPVNPQMYSTDADPSDWNIENPLWITDTADKWSVLNGRIALDKLSENA
jgi:hypothetical protein